VCGLFFVESVAWFNGGPARMQRPGGDDINSGGKGQDPNDPSDDGLLQFCCCIVRNDL